MWSEPEPDMVKGQSLLNVKLKLYFFKAYSNLWAWKCNFPPFQDINNQFTDLQPDQVKGKLHINKVYNTIKYKFFSTKYFSLDTKILWNYWEENIEVNIQFADFNFAP